MSYYPPQQPHWQHYGPQQYEPAPYPSPKKRRLWPWFVVGTVVLVTAVAAALAVVLWPRGGGAGARPTPTRPSITAKGPLTSMSPGVAGALLTGAAKFPDEYQTRLFSSDATGIGSEQSEEGVRAECRFPIRPGTFAVLQQLISSKPDDEFGADMVIMMLFTWTGQDQAPAFKAWPGACPEFSPPPMPGDGYTATLTNLFSATPVPGDFPDAVGVKEEIVVFKTDNTPGAGQQKVSSLPRYNYLVTVRGVALLGSCSGEAHHDLCDQIYKNTVSALRNLP